MTTGKKLWRTRKQGLSIGEITRQQIWGKQFAYNFDSDTPR
jgi:hypothetical protein